MSVIEGAGKVGAAELGIGRVKAAVGLYDFAVEGGAVGDIALRGNNIPSGAIILDSLIEVDTVPTSGGSPSLAVKVESAADINAAAAISGAPWSTTGIKRGDLNATATPVKTTAERTITATVATAALTAGKFQVIVFYIEFAD
jgi:hypothetical protein